MPFLNSRNVIILGAIFCLFFLLYLFGWLAPAKSALRAFIVPVSSKLADWGINYNENYQFYQNRQNFLTAYHKYEQENQGLNFAQARLAELEMENNELKKQINFFNSHKYTKITTRVIGKNTDSAENMLILDAGEDSGIGVGQPVVVGEGILIGIIEKINKQTSFARLINDNLSKVAATIINKEKSLGVVEGGYGLSVRMNFIPRNETIIVGNQIITSGLEEKVPRGLLIGEVAVSENEAYQPFQQAVLTTSADLNKIFIVSVITSK